MTLKGRKSANTATVTASEPSRRGAATLKVMIETSACRGEGLCERICPQVFEIVNGVVRLKRQHLPPVAWSTCIEAAENCPYKVIRLTRCRAASP